MGAKPRRGKPRARACGGRQALGLLLVLGLLGAGCAGDRAPGPWQPLDLGSGGDWGGGTDRGDGGDQGWPDLLLGDGITRDHSSVCAKKSFPLTQTQVAFKVPQKVRYMHVKAWGAGGNGEGQCALKDDGGVGGYAEAVFSATPGTTLTVIVGQRGRAGLSGEDLMKFGFGNWGGGGLSGVFQGGATIGEKDWSRALVIAGGGGSAGAPGCNPGGPGNAGNAGGMATMKGGSGVDGINGGAGGYRGGKGGAKGKAGLGGKGYVAPAALKSKLVAGAPAKNTPPNTGDPDYDGSAGKTEKSGRVVIHFVCALPPIQ